MLTWTCEESFFNDQDVNRKEIINSVNLYSFIYNYDHRYNDFSKSKYSFINHIGNLSNVI